jgi:hypothetical protein
MKALRDKGYYFTRSIVSPFSPWYQLAWKPVLITLDDTREEQYRIGATEMKNRVLGHFYNDCFKQTSPH